VKQGHESPCLKTYRTPGIIGGLTVECPGAQDGDHLGKPVLELPLGVFSVDIELEDDCINIGDYKWIRYTHGPIHNVSHYTASKSELIPQSLNCEYD